MKNVTITLDEEVAAWARIRAARQNKSVSRLIAEMLEERMALEEGYERAMTEDLSVPPIPLTQGARYPRRAELYD